MIEQYLNKIICGDCLEVMRQMPDASVDLVVTSPPYNLKNSTGNGMKDGRGGKWANAALVNGYATYDDNMPYNQYCKWQRDCLSEMMRLIKDDGAIFYNHKWRVQNGLIQDGREIVNDFPIRQIIIWKRKGGINFNSGVKVNREQERVEVVFDSGKCIPRHSGWLSEVEKRVGLGPLPTTPYWGFNDLFSKVGTKLLNCFYVQAEVKREGRKEYFHYNKVLMLSRINLQSFLDCIENGKVFVDFDARTGHNHGTKMRIAYKDIPGIYGEVKVII